MKINSVKTLVEENGVAKIIAIIGDTEQEIGAIENYRDSADLHEMVKDFLEKNDFQIVPLQNDEIYDQKADLKIVRTKMRKALLKLDSEDLSLKQKQELLPVYQQMCQASQVILNACKVELQINQVKGKK